MAKVLIEKPKTIRFDKYMSTTDFNIIKYKKNLIEKSQI